MKFRCPVCSCPEFARVIVKRADGTPYRSDLLHCLSCTLVFLEPELFTAAAKYREEQSPTAGAHRMDHEHALDRQALEFRFWEAKLKRKDGGCKPKPDRVVAYKMRMDVP